MYVLEAFEKGVSCLCAKSGDGCLVELQNSTQVFCINGNTFNRASREGVRERETERLKMGVGMLPRFVAKLAGNLFGLGASGDFILTIIKKDETFGGAGFNLSAFNCLLLNKKPSNNQNMSEAEKIKKLLDEQVKSLKQKRMEVLSRVKSELDDIDRALRQLGHGESSGQSVGGGRGARRNKVDDQQIKSSLLSFMKPGEWFSAAELLKKAGIKAARFANFKASQKDFFKTQGAKRSMRYSLNG